jgi:hypothetical protein
MAEQETANSSAQRPVSHVHLLPDAVHTGGGQWIRSWLFEEGPWWLCSFVFHVVLVFSLALLSGRVVQKIVDEAPSFDEADIQRPTNVPQDIERFEVGETPQDPTELSTETLMLEKPGEITQEAKHYDDSSTFTEAKGGGVMAMSNQPNVGGIGGFDIKAASSGATVKGKGGVGVGVGVGMQPGTGGESWGFGGRGTGSRKAMLGSGGGTRQSERAVAGALNWLARHQSPDGSWSLTEYKARCKDASCTGEAKAGSSISAATALALLPFLGAGQTHESSKSPYKQNVRAGISYLIRNQKPDGDLRMGSTMYAHGLASIALCECYGMSGDKRVGVAAKAALNFIMQAQDPIGGGWRYQPLQPGDTSVVGWQIMALKSGQMAYLSVNPVVFEKAKQFLKSVSSGTSGRLGPGSSFKYMAEGDYNISPSLTAVGLLCCQYMGALRTDPAMIEGTAVLMRNQPVVNGRNLYYWYYATQVMHNQPGPNWDVWNRKMRRILIDTQCKDSNCTAGSWDPIVPKPDAYGHLGGRLYLVSLSALTLEVYYRYLPLYKLEQQSEPVDAAGEPVAAEPAEKAESQETTEPAKKPVGKDETTPVTKASK